MSIISQPQNHVILANMARRVTPQTIWSQNQLTLDFVRGALASFDVGDFRSMGVVEDAIYTDTRLYGIIQQRLKAVASRMFRFLPGPGENGNRILELVVKNKNKIFPHHIVGSFVIDPIMTGIKVYQLEWIETHEGIIPTLQTWDTQNLRVDANNSFAILGSTKNGEVVIERNSHAWFIAEPFGPRYGFRRALIRAASDAYIRRLYNLNDSQRFCEVNGNPIIVCKIPQEFYNAEKQEYLEALQNLASRSVVPSLKTSDGQSIDIGYLEPNGEGFAAIEKSLELIRDEMSILILGQNLTTSVSEGSFAAAEVHDNIRHLYATSDKERIKEMMQDICKMVAIENGGTEDDGCIVEVVP